MLRSMSHFIDLSIPITNDVVSDPEVMRPKIQYMTHDSTWEQIAMFFPGLEQDDLPMARVEMLELHAQRHAYGASSPTTTAAPAPLPSTKRRSTVSCGPA